MYVVKCTPLRLSSFILQPTVSAYSSNQTPAFGFLSGSYYVAYAGLELAT